MSVGIKGILPLPCTLVLKSACKGKISLAHGCFSEPLIASFLTVRSVDFEMGLSCKCCYHNLSHYTIHWEEAFSVRLCWECIRPWVELVSDSNPGFLREHSWESHPFFLFSPLGVELAVLFFCTHLHKARADWNLTWKSMPPAQFYRFYFSRLWQTGEAAPWILQSPRSSSCRAAPSTKSTEKEHSASTQCSAPGNQVS